MTATSSSAQIGASPDAIRHHYDLSNEFYRLWLDPALIYSAALWHANEGLAAAQNNKLDWHLDQAGVQAGHRLLEIGCGWGGLLRRAVETRGVHSVVGLSLSLAQTDWIRELDLRGVEVRVESWLAHEPLATYDSIISIGAFEHFARLDQTPEQKLSGYEQFFDACHRMLTPGGRLSLQTMTYENASAADFSSFFAEQIFPESNLPHLWEIASAARGRFEIVTLRNDRHDYAHTWRHWLQGLKANRERAVSIVGIDTYKTYEKYMQLMMIGFHVGNMNLTRIGLKRIDR